MAKNVKNESQIFLFCSDDVIYLTPERLCLGKSEQPHAPKQPAALNLLPGFMCTAEVDPGKSHYPLNDSPY